MGPMVRGGDAKPIDSGVLERVGQMLRATLDVWFGPLNPLPQVAPAETPPRRFDYPSGVNLTTLPRGHEAIGFQQDARSWRIPKTDRRTGGQVCYVFSNPEMQKNYTLTLAVLNHIGKNQIMRGLASIVMVAAILLGMYHSM